MQFFKYWLPFYLYAALIFFLSSIPTLPSYPPFLFSDKLLHLIEYTVFGYLAARAFKNSKSSALKVNFRLLAFLCGVIYGLSDEFHQLFVPNRQADIGDVGVDVLGTLLGVILMNKVNNIFIKKRNGFLMK